MPSKDKIVATLTIVVNYEEVPDTSELRDLVETANQIGSVETAKLTFLKEATQDLTKY